MPRADHDPRDYATSVGLDPDRLPRHVAVIMDGNGRWAQGRGLPRLDGHLKGAEVVRDTVTEACRLGLGQLTLYCFSAENWKRPADEVACLMELLKAYLINERERIQAEGIRFRVIGRRGNIPPEVLAEIDHNTALSAGNTGMTLCLAINYGSRAEIVDAVRAIATRVERGLLDAAAIDEATVDSALYTAGMPDPDLLIRTAGEMRVSNYLLWQISYAELWVTPLAWPAFEPAVFHDALRDFARRNRRFGGLTNSQGAAG